MEQRTPYRQGRNQIGDISFASCADVGNLVVGGYMAFRVNVRQVEQGAPLVRNRSVGGRVQEVVKERVHVTRLQKVNHWTMGGI
jgi:hypothetical protein